MVRTVGTWLWESQFLHDIQRFLGLRYHEVTSGKDWKVLETYCITDTKNILKAQPSQCCIRKQRTQIFDCYYFNVHDHKEWASLYLAKVIYVANYCIIVKETKCFIIACWTVPSQGKWACWSCLSLVSEGNLRFWAKLTGLWCLKDSKIARFRWC